MEKFLCPNCKREVEKSETEFTYDCNGIPFRRLCRECCTDIMENRGYDGRYYNDDCCEDIF